MSAQFAPWSVSGHTHTSLETVKDEDEDCASPSTSPNPDIRTYSSSLHRHRDSVSSTTSDSATSSPTTTASLVDTHSIGETPGTSPDTPASNQSLAGYSSLSNKVLSNKALRIDTRPLPAANELPKPCAPGKKGRNLKNLAVDTSTAFPLGRAISTATLPLQPPQEAMATYLSPATPGFVRPGGSRQKASGLGLTIQTNTNSKEDGAVPPTPSLIRPASLRHYQSSPSLNVFSSTFGPEGGMKLPSITTARKTVTVGFADAPMENDEDDVQNFDVPQSREEKPESYPDGPICIYDPHVYLFYEPTAEQASRYDVIFNVASEVKNPFQGPAKDLEAAEASDALNVQRRTSSPSTPKASATSTGLAAPEYIHIPWEHNTDIVPDLHRLVKVIDKRVQQGKRVLIHCQCGVSRSASLIVAYGIFRNPSITVQEAYDAVKRRSKWIGPNMNLIMQLQEFRSGLLRADAGVAKPISKTSLARPSLNRSQSAQGEQFVRTHSRMPQSAPLVPEDLPPIPSEIQSAHPAGLSVPPGPSSAPSGYQWPSSAATLGQEIPEMPTLHVQRPSISQPPTAIEAPPNHGDYSQPRLATRVEPPKRPSLSTDVASSGILSPRGTEFAMISTLPPAAVDDSFGLTSPRNATFGNMAAPPTLVPTLAAPKPLRVTPGKPISHLREDSSSVSSPRSSAFHMTPFARPGAQDDGFGLTSPRGLSFGSGLPHRPRSTPPPQELKKMFPVLPTPQDRETMFRESQARAELGGKIGLTRRSNYDLRAAFNSGTRGTAPEVPPLPTTATTPKVQPISTSLAGQMPAAPALEESLMSPREATFTDNPFSDSTQAASLPGRKQDPRSPPQKGGSPIVRSIFDVL